MTKPRRILSVWLPLWRTDLWRRRHPDVSASYPLVLRAHDGRRQMIIAADRVARSMGIKSGMTLSHAQALVPALHVEAATPEADDAALERLAEWALWVSPIVGADPPDGIWIDTTGCDHLRGGEVALLAEIARQLAALGYTVRLALADTAGAAHALARYGRERVTIVPPGGHAGAIAGLPAASLRLEPSTLAGLGQMGLHTIAALMAAPRAPLVRRFGADLLRQLDRALGHVSEPIPALRPHEAIATRESFVEPIGTAEAIGTVIDVLVPRISEALRTRGHGARLADLLCESVDGTTQAVRVGLAAPVNDPAHLARLLHERIETIAPGFGIEAMRLVISRAEPMGAVLPTGRLVADKEHEVDLACLIDRLRNRVGPERVTRLDRHPSHLPERSQTAIPIAGDAAVIAWPAAGMPRPTRLLDPPQAIEVIALLPDGAPRLFVWSRARHRVRAADGPERLHGEWWAHANDHGAVRDYWIAEDEAGERFWLYRRGDGQNVWSGDGAWFLHGLF